MRTDTRRRWRVNVGNKKNGRWIAATTSFLHSIVYTFGFSPRPTFIVFIIAAAAAAADECGPAAAANPPSNYHSRDPNYCSGMSYPIHCMCPTNSWSPSIMEQQTAADSLILSSFPSGIKTTYKLLLQTILVARPLFIPRSSRSTRYGMTLGQGSNRLANSFVFFFMVRWLVPRQVRNRPKRKSSRLMAIKECRVAIVKL